MDRPSFDKPVFGPEKDFRLVAKTQSAEEANRIAGQYELQGFDTKITRKTQGGITLYEVWVAKAPDVFSAPPRRT